MIDFCEEKSMTLFVRLKVGNAYDFDTDHIDRMMSQILESREFLHIVAGLFKESHNE